MRNYELKRLRELQEHNYCGSIICDVALADEMKKLNEVWNGHSY